MKLQLKMVGYWSGDPESHECWIHPSILVAPGFYGTEKKQVVAYLKAGHRINFELGYSFCRFEDGPPDSEMGSCDMTDGRWVWPEGLWIYVERYDVRLPEEFLSNARSLNFKMPEQASELSLNLVRYDATLWDQWCRMQISSSNTPV